MKNSKSSHSYSSNIGYQPPQQIALGLNYKNGNNLYLTGIGAAGLSNFTPAYIFSVGIKISI